MKHAIFKTIITAVGLLFSPGVMAQNSSVITKTINGQAAGEINPGEVTCAVADGLGTITVKPAGDYYLTAENISVTKVVEGTNAQTRLGVAEPVAVTATDAKADPSGETTYTFKATNEKYIYKITADFKSRISIEGAEITTDKDIYPYTGEVIEPTVTVKLSDADLTLDTDYTVSYKNNVSIKESTAEVDAPTVILTGKGKYTGTATKTFTIGKGAGTISYETATVNKYPSDVAFTNELTNSGDGTVTYGSSAEDVATVEKTTGEVTIVGPGEATITATVVDGTNYAYETKTASYTLTVEALETDDYLLWVGDVQVTAENKADILRDVAFGEDQPRYVFNEKTSELFINNCSTPFVIESRLSDLIINIRSESENIVKKIFFNNEGDATRKGNLMLTTYGNVPGKLDIDAPVNESAISGFENVTIDNSKNIYLVDPEKAEYINGNFMDADTIVRKMSIGQHCKTLSKNETITIKTEEYTIKDETGVVVEKNLTNGVIINDIVHNLGENDGLDSEDHSLAMNTSSNPIDVDKAIKTIMDESVALGSSGCNQILSDNNVKCLTGILPDGNGDIDAEVSLEDNYQYGIKIGDEPVVSFESSGLPDTRLKYTIKYSYSFENRLMVFFLMHEGGGSRTRIGRRETAHGRLYSLRVKPRSTATTNPATEFGLSSGEVEEVVTEGGSTGIESISRNIIDMNLYDLQGRKHSGSAKPGIYIRNHKKIIIK